LIKKLHDAKVPLLAGTDAPAGYDLVPGTSIHRELQLLVRAGLTINNTRSVVTVVGDGRYYSARELDALRLKVMELAAK